MRLLPLIFATVLFATVAVSPPIAEGAETFVLTVTPSTINFPDSDPDTSPTVQAGAVSVSLNPSGVGGSTTWYLHLLARGNLVAGSATIPISNISWTATNQPIYKNGTMTTSVPGTLVAQSMGNQTKTSTLTFSLQNLWTYATGTYLQTVDFTATAP